MVIVSGWSHGTRSLRIPCFAALISQMLHADRFVTFTPRGTEYFRDLRDMFASGQPPTAQAGVETKSRYATEPAVGHTRADSKSSRPGSDSSR